MQIIYKKKDFDVKKIKAKIVKLKKQAKANYTLFKKTNKELDLELKRNDTLIEKMRNKKFLYFFKAYDERQIDFLHDASLSIIYKKRFILLENFKTEHGLDCDISFLESLLKIENDIILSESELELLK